ncbi:MAG: GTPase [Candidatus Bathyarchaeia archaeon]|nr:50S ribosome-binding GTPase [Candidatus Bathyarchaeota archaeon]
MRLDTVRAKAVRGFMPRTGGRGSWFRVRRIIDEANIILEVLDSRDPLGTRSLELERLVRRRGKDLLLALNKADLVPENVLNDWIGFFKSRGYRVFPLSARGRRTILPLEEYLKSTGKRRIVLAVVGYPNVGKSTIINRLKGRRVAGTSPIPGYTRGEKMVRVDDRLILVDTPGVLPVGRTDPSSLALKGFIPPEKLRDPLTPALKLLREVLDSMPKLLSETYGIEENDPYELLEALAHKRGLLLKGGELNIEEAARLILRDWQTGKLRFYREIP